MRINVSSNISTVARFLTDVEKKQIPFAASQALNDVAKKAAMVDLREKAKKIFAGGATRFTQTGFLYRKSTKKNLTAEVFIEPKRGKYMKFQIDGGTRFPERRKIMIPTNNTRLNKFGNIPRGTYARIINDKTKFFSGIPKGLAGEDNRGIWERYGRSKRYPSGKRIRKVASYIDRAQYRPIYPFAETTSGVVFGRQDGFALRFNVRLAAALRSRKRK
jgi:hypothetical protein